MFSWKLFEIIELLPDMFVVIMLEMKYRYNKAYCFYLHILEVICTFEIYIINHITVNFVLTLKASTIQTF